MNFWVQLGILIVTTLISRALAPKPPKQKPALLEDFNLPTAEAGRPIPVVFGTVKIPDPIVVWYGDLGVQTDTEDGVRRRWYYLGMHHVLCHGPIDSIGGLEVGGKMAWEGAVDASDSVSVAASGLFGGIDAEGGVSGALTFAFGESTQTPNTYLQSVLGTPIPAYRGVVSAIWERGTVSANTSYLRPWAYGDVKRVFQGWDSGACWYPEKAEVAASFDADSYDVYASGQEGGPALDYWWKMTGSLTLGGTYASVGTEVGDLTFSGSSAASASFNEVGLTLNTADSLGVARSGGYQNHFYTAAGALQGGNWSAGCWRRFGNTDEQIVLKSNIGGEQGKWRGIDVWRPARSSPSEPAPTHLEVVFGDNANGYARYKSPDGTISDDGIHFIVLRTTDLAVTAGTQYGSAVFTAPLEDVLAAVELFIDGVVQPLTEVLDTLTGPIVFPDYATSPDGWVGVAFDAMGDTYGDYPNNELDEPFVYRDALTAAQIAEMDRRGRGGGSWVGDMNFAHIIYASITERWGMGYGSSVIDEDSFIAAADTFYDEGMGGSFKWSRQSTVEEFQQEVLDHCGAVLRISPRTGKFQLKPIRDDYDPDTLTVYDEDHVIAVESWERAGYGELVGEVSVVYRQKSDNTDQVVTLQNLATIQAQSGVVSETVQYPMISRHELAARVCMRDLKARSVPLARGRVKLDRTAWELAPGDVIKLSWARLGLTEIICRVVTVDYGTLAEGAITVDLVEDVFGLPASTYATQQASAWTDIDVTSPSAALNPLLAEDGTALLSENDNALWAE